MTNIWDREDIKNSEYDVTSQFLTKAMAPESSMALKLVDILKKTRDSDLGKQKVGDTYFMVCFVDEQGKERTIDQNGARGALMKAMKAVDLQPSDKLSLTRHGEGIEMSWDITKLSPDGLPVPQYVPETTF